MIDVTLEECLGELKHFKEKTMCMSVIKKQEAEFLSLKVHPLLGYSKDEFMSVRDNGMSELFELEDQLLKQMSSLTI